MTQDQDPTPGTPDDLPADPGPAGEAAAPAASEAPSAALQGYPREASPEADDDTRPVQVPGEQTEPARRLDVFPEDGVDPPA